MGYVICIPVHLPVLFVLCKVQKRKLQFGRNLSHVVIWEWCNFHSAMIFNLEMPSILIIEIIMQIHVSGRVRLQQF